MHFPLGCFFPPVDNICLSVNCVEDKTEDYCAVYLSCVTMLRLDKYLLLLCYAWTWVYISMLIGLQILHQ